MAKVGISIGVTMHIGAPANNEYLKYTITIDEVDTEIPLEGQLQSIRDTLNWVNATAEKGLERKIEEEMGRKLS